MGYLIQIDRFYVLWSCFHTVGLVVLWVVLRVVQVIIRQVFRCFPNFDSRLGFYRGDKLKQPKLDFY
jgi:hypothetical protein